MTTCTVHIRSSFFKPLVFIYAKQKSYSKASEKQSIIIKQVKIIYEWSVVKKIQNMPSTIWMQGNTVRKLKSTVAVANMLLLLLITIIITTIIKQEHNDWVVYR